jgi:hypothetical protein
MTFREQAERPITLAEVRHLLLGTAPDSVAHEPELLQVLSGREQ